VIVQGVVHLLTGFDHLAFLLVALLAVARRRDVDGNPRPLGTVMFESFKVITAFTVAHSITLTLAALGVVVLAPGPVETSIAATVAVTAIAGFWKPTRFHGWPVAFAFGLVHGFGFAGALSRLVGGEAHAAGIAAFNLGIELAQIAVAMLIVPALYLLTRRAAAERVAAPAISACVTLAALGWFIERAA